MAIKPITNNKNKPNEEKFEARLEYIPIYFLTSAVDG